MWYCITKEHREIVKNFSDFRTVSTLNDDMNSMIRRNFYRFPQLTVFRCTFYRQTGRETVLKNRSIYDMHL